MFQTSSNFKHGSHCMECYEWVDHEGVVHDRTRSVTVPDQAIPLNKLISDYTRGVEVPILDAFYASYDTEHDGKEVISDPQEFPDPRRFDPAELQIYYSNLKQQLKETAKIVRTDGKRRRDERLKKEEEDAKAEKDRLYKEFLERQARDSA